MVRSSAATPRTEGAEGTGRRAGAGTALIRDPVLTGLAGIAVLTSVWYLLGPGGITAQVSLFWLIQVGLDAVFTTSCWQVARSRLLRPPAREFWRWVSAGGACFILADSLQLGFTLANPVADMIGAEAEQALLVALGLSLLLVAVLRYPIRAQGRERLRWWLDAATIMMGAAAFMWYATWTGSGPVLTRLSIAVFLTGVTLVGAFAVINLLIGGDPPFSRAAGTLAGITTVLVGLATAVGTAPRTVEVLGLEPTLVMRMLPLFLLAAVPRVQWVEMRVNPQVLARRPKHMYSRLPYFAVGAAQLLLVYVLLADGLGIRAWGVLGAAMLDTALLVIRQMVAFTDNNRLLSDLDQAMSELSRQEHRFRSLVQRASDITIVTGRDLVITYSSPASLRVLGIADTELQGQDLRSRVHPDDMVLADGAFSDMLAAPRATLTAQVRMRHADGSFRWLEVIGTNLLDDPTIAGIIYNMRDVTEAHEFQQHLHYQATHDSLTRLPNRMLFDERTRSDLPGGPAPEATVSVLAIDVDDFKLVNDTFGHSVGDRLLVAVAGRLRRCVRPQDTVARFGGDEFAVMLPGASADEATAVAERIRAALSEPVVVEGHRIRVQVSVGATVGRASAVDGMLRVSDEAMYEAKRTGKGIVLRPAEDVPSSRPSHG